MSQATKDRILTNAEWLFAEEGYSATSLRRIVRKAGVNLGAVHYYFHSKEALLEAIIVRHAAPANAERLALLESYEQQADGGVVPVEKIIEAFMIPILRVANDPGGITFLRLLGRLYSEGDLIARIIYRHFGEILNRFATVVARSVPEVPPSEIYWRLYFGIGVIAQAMRGGRELQMVHSNVFGTPEPDAILQRVIPFLSAGLRAPVAMATGRRME